MLILGIKWNFRTAPPDSQRVLLAASLYIEAPTGNVHQQLGSGLADVALNLIGEKPFSSATRLNLNLGFLFAGNTSTGAISNSNHTRPRRDWRRVPPALLYSTPHAGS